MERTRFQIPQRSLRTFGKFDHPTLPQFAQLYKGVPGNTDSGGNVKE